MRPTILLTLTAVLGPAQAQTPAVERDALLGIQVQGGGPVFPGWKNGTDPCSNRWQGVTCSTTGNHVTELTASLQSRQMAKAGNNVA